MLLNYKKIYRPIKHYLKRGYCAYIGIQVLILLKLTQIAIAVLPTPPTVGGASVSGDNPLEYISAPPAGSSSPPLSCWQRSQW